MEGIMEGIMEQAGIPFLVALASLYYAYRLLFLKEIDAIRGKDKKRLSQEERNEYAKKAGLALIFFAIGAVLMGVIVIFNTTAGFIEMIIWIAISFYIWKRISDQYS